MGDRQASEQQAAIAAALMEALAARYPKRFSEEERASLLAEIEWLVGARQALRAVPLANGDEPSFIFHPYREDR